MATGDSVAELEHEAGLPEGALQSTVALYAAGRTAAGIPRTSKGYASGMSVADATFFGRQAGKSAAH